MQLKFIRFLALVCVTATAYAASISLPFNTGVGADGQVLSGGSTDGHYSSSGNLPVFDLSNPPYWAWIGADQYSAWIGPDAYYGGGFNGGYYTLDYSVAFDVEGFDPSSVTLQGEVAVDNMLNSISVNGTGNTTPVAASFNSWSPFTLNSGFVAGINTIDFSFTNRGDAGGIRVEFTSATGTASTPTPEPTPLALIGLAITFVGLYRRGQGSKATTKLNVLRTAHWQSFMLRLISRSGANTSWSKQQVIHENPEVTKKFIARTIGTWQEKRLHRAVHRKNFKTATLPLCPGAPSADFCSSTVCWKAGTVSASPARAD